MALLLLSINEGDKNSLSGPVVDVLQKNRAVEELRRLIDEPEFPISLHGQQAWWAAYHATVRNLCVPYTRLGVPMCTRTEMNAKGAKGANQHDGALQERLPPRSRLCELT
jgi:hypothetical protein